MRTDNRFLPPGLGATLSGPIGTLPESPISDVAMSVFGDPDVVPLWFGEGDLVTPDFVRDAAAAALQAGETFYTWQRGIPDLRTALSAYTEKLYGIKCPVDRISATTGGMQAILLSVQMLVDPGDNVVIVSPIWPNITSATKLMRGVPKYVALERTKLGGWTLDLQRVFDAVDERTRAIFVNSPGNPTGWVMSSDEQRALLDFARKRGIWIMADEVYARLIYTKRPDGRQVAPSFLEHAGPDDPLIVLNSFSKPWAMTGWRIGWLVHPKSVEPAAAAMAQCNNSGATHFVQYGALAALSPEGDAFRGTLLERCRAGRDVVEQWIGRQNRVRWFKPDGAFYGFLHVDGLKDSLDFCQDMVRNEKVGVSPGWAFSLGDTRDASYVRICFAQDTAKLSDALARLEGAIRKL